MSQLVSAIQSFDTGERKILRSKRSKLFEDLVDLESQIHEDRSAMSVAKIYKIGLKIGNQVTISDHELLRNEHALTDAINNTKRSVIEAVFGEFRPTIRLIYDALYDHDVEKARFLLIKLEEQMFEVDNEQL